MTNNADLLWIALEDMWNAKPENVIKWLVRSKHPICVAAIDKTGLSSKR